jgi:hypothetical protein
LHIYKYDSAADLTEQDDYAYANGTPTTLLRKTLISFAVFQCTNALGRPAQITIQDGLGNIKSQTTYTYDQGTPATTSGTPQHVVPNCPFTRSLANLTTVASLVQGSTTLNKTFTYYDTGTVKTATDVNNGLTTFNYPDWSTTCGNAFPTSVTEAVSGLSRSMTWNCNGAVQLTSTDENGKTTTAAYGNDRFYWRPDSVTDATGTATNLSYATSSPYNWVESKITFNSGNSVVDQFTITDTLGRAHLQQTWQSPSAPNYDTVETDYDVLGRVSRVTLPYSGTSGQTNSSAPATTFTFDALSRTKQAKDAGNGTVSYTYNQNDALIVVGPAPTGENPSSASSSTIPWAASSPFAKSLRLVRAETAASRHPVAAISPVIRMTPSRT